MGISIVIPVYNVEKYLRECLQSIVDQVKESVEVILVDDGSKDSSGAICDEYANKYAFINVIHKKNEGVSVARNVGIKESNGKFIMFVDSDDVLAEGVIEKVFEKIKDNADMYTLSFEKIDEDGNLMTLEDKKEIPEGTYDKKKFLEEYYNNFKTFPWAVWQSLYKKSIIEKNNIEFPTGVKVAEDTDFYMKYIEHIEKITYINSPIIKYRVDRPGSAMKAMKVEKILDAFKIYSKYFYGDDKFYSKYFANLYVASFNYIARLESQDDVKRVIESIDSKIVKSSTGTKFNIFKVAYFILGKRKAIGLLIKLRG